MDRTLKALEKQQVALDAYVKMVRSVSTLLAAVRTQSPLPAGMSFSQFQVLEALLHRGPLQQSEISRKILKSTGNITVVVDHLERDGLVERGKDPKDRRVSKVKLTPRGRKRIASYFPRHARAITATLGVLPVAEQKTLAELCKRLGLGIESRLTDNGGAT